MFNNPMQIFQLIGQLKSNPNPMNAMQGMFGNNPMFQQAINMVQGKSPQEQKQTVMNYCQTKGIDFNQIQTMAQQMGFKI